MNSNRDPVNSGNISSPEEAVKKQIEAAYAQYRRAVKHDDPEEMARFYRDLTTADFEEKGTPGDSTTTATREQMLTSFEPLVQARSFGYSARYELLTSVDALDVSGEVATAVLSHRFRRVESGTDPEPWQEDCWQETWIAPPRGWRLQAKQRLKLR